MSWRFACLRIVVPLCKPEQLKDREAILSPSCPRWAADNCFPTESTGLKWLSLGIVRGVLCAQNISITVWKHSLRNEPNCCFCIFQNGASTTFWCHRRRRNVGVGFHLDVSDRHNLAKAAALSWCFAWSPTETFQTSSLQPMPYRHMLSICPH